MRQARLFLWLLAATAACGSAWASGVPAVNDTAKQPIAIKTTVAPKEVREYQLEAWVKGKMPAPDLPQPLDVDARFSFRVRHQYARRESDGLLPLDISLVTGEITTQGQKLQITPNIYPKLTVLLERDWRITDVFGMSATSAANSLPGINYGNIIMLFYLVGADQPHAIGDKWQWTVKMPAYGESFSFAATLRSVDEEDGSKLALIHEDITRLASDTDTRGIVTKAAVDSTFSMDNGKLLKSHVDCDVTYPQGKADPKSPSRQDQGPYHANIRIDISLAK